MITQFFQKNNSTCGKNIKSLYYRKNSWKGSEKMRILFLEYFVSDLPKLGINCYFCCNHTIASQTEPLKKWIILFPSKSILS